MAALRVIVFGMALPMACSWATVRVPHEVTSGFPRTCPENAAVADSVVAVAFLGLGLFAVGHDAVVTPPSDGRRGGKWDGTIVIGLPSLLIGGLTGASAIYGWNARRRCQRLNDEATRTPAP